MAATNEQIIAFIKLVAPLAIAECNRRAAAGEGFVLPSVCIGQGAHETGWGTSSRMTAANALFGIKAGGSWTGKVFTADTFEVKDGVAYNTVANFRAYDSVADSVHDYYELMTNARYANALSTLNEPKTAVQTVTALWQAGYATDPPYVELVMNIIKGRDLTQYDSKVTGIADSDGTINGETIYTEPPPLVDAYDAVKFTFQKIELS